MTASAAACSALADVTVTGMRPWPTTLSLTALVLLAGCGGDAVAGTTNEDSGGASSPTVALVPLTQLAGGESTTVAPLPEPRPQTVAVVGDSLSVQSEPALEAALETLSLEIVGFDAVQGRRIRSATELTTSGVDAVEATLDGAEPDLWVIALGTNDVDALDREGYREAVEELLAGVPDGAPVIWVDAWVERWIDDAKQANEVLREVAAERPGMTVVDWFQFGDDPGLISDDGVHLTDAGELKFAEQVAAEFLARFG